MQNSETLLSGTLNGPNAVTQISSCWCKVDCRPAQLHGSDGRRPWKSATSLVLHGAGLNFPNRHVEFRCPLLHKKVTLKCAPDSPHVFDLKETLTMVLVTSWLRLSQKDDLRTCAFARAHSALKKFPITTPMVCKSDCRKKATESIAPFWSKRSKILNESPSILIYNF